MSGERLLPNPIATSEMQAYWYAGLEQAALAFLALGEPGYALRLRRQALRLKARFHRSFWMANRDAYALALGPEKGAGALDLLQYGPSASRRASCRAYVGKARLRRMMDTGSLQRLGHPHALQRSPGVQPVQLSPRQRLARRVGHCLRLRAIWMLGGTLAARRSNFCLNRTFHRQTGCRKLSVASRDDPAHAHPGIYPNEQ